MAAQPPSKPKSKLSKTLARFKGWGTRKQGAVEPEPELLDEHEESDFVALFRCTPEQMSPPMRRLSETYPLPGDQTSRIDDRCICKDLLREMITYARHNRGPFIKASSRPAAHNIGSFVASSTECHLCNLMRWHLQHSTSYNSLGGSGGQNSSIDIFFYRSHLDTVTLRLLGFKLIDFAVLPIVDDVTVGSSIPPPSTSFLATSPRNEESSSRMARWLRECKQHGECATTEVQYLPSRVIDVGSKECPYVRLHVSSEQEVGVYTALSYCWGGYNGMKLTTSRLESFQEGLEEEVLPKTYKDAIFVTRNLGIRYLWIDALTILQDSESDWQSECGKMDQVYGNARLTLCASNAASASEGFLKDRDPRTTALAYCGLVSHEQVYYPVYLTEKFHGVRDTLAFEDIASTLYGQLREEPLTSRGWAVQERLLSRRILYFTSDRLIWQCRHAILTEDGTNHKSQPGLQLATIPDALHIVIRWYNIVESYSHCKLSKSSDRLPALAGVARAFGEHTQDFYAYGHWREGLIGSLLWRSYGGYRNPENLAPSWSWASMSSGVWFSSLHSLSEDKYAARILEEKTLASGIVNICAPVAAATLLGSGSQSLLRFNDVPDIDADRQVTVDLDECETVRQCTVVILIESKDGGLYTPRFRGLLLESARFESTEYRRIGTFSENRLDSRRTRQPMMPSLPRKRISIV